MDSHDNRDELVGRLTKRCAALELERDKLLERIDEMEGK